MSELSTVLIGCLAGVFVGISGIGAGAIVAPLLMNWSGAQPHEVVATSLCFAALAKLIAAKSHMMAGSVDWKVVRLLWFGSLPATCIVIFANSRIGMDFDTSLTVKAVGMAILFSGAWMLAHPFVIQNVTKEVRMCRVGKFTENAFTVFFGAFTGVVVTMTSVGAGALISFFLALFYPLKMTPSRRVGTNLAHAVPLSFIASLGYIFAGSVNGSFLMYLLVGGLPCAMLGGVMSSSLPERNIQVLLAFCLLAAGCQLLTWDHPL